MEFLLKLTLLWIITQVRIETVRTEESSISSYDLILDFKNDTGTALNVSPVEEKYEDWFFYYDNLTPSGLTDLSKEYFKDVNLQEVESAGWVWVAFFTELGAPIFGVPFPAIELHLQYQIIEVVELTYCLHGSGNITITDDKNEMILKKEEPTAVPKWKTYLLETGPSWSGSISIHLMPNAIGDFVLIDKVQLWRLETISTTTKIPSSSPFNTATMPQISDPTTPSTIPTTVTQTSSSPTMTSVQTTTVELTTTLPTTSLTDEPTTVTEGGNEISRDTTETTIFLTTRTSSSTTTMAQNTNNTGCKSGVSRIFLLLTMIMIMAISAIWN